MSVEREISVGLTGEVGDHHISTIPESSLSRRSSRNRRGRGRFWHH